MASIAKESSHESLSSWTICNWRAIGAFRYCLARGGGRGQLSPAQEIQLWCSRGQSLANISTTSPSIPPPAASIFRTAPKSKSSTPTPARSIGDITGLKLVHGVAVAPEFGRGFISDGAQGKVFVFDLKTLKITGEANAAKDADCVAYDPFSKRVFVMEGDPNSATAIDAKTGAVVKTIDLGGGPEFAVADGKGTVYINLEDKSELVAVDSRTCWKSNRAGLSLPLEAHSSRDGRGAPPALQRWPQSADDGRARLRQRKSHPVVPDLRRRRRRPPTSPRLASFSFPPSKAKSTYSTRTLPTNSAKSKPSRPNTARKPWASTPKLTNLFLDTADFAPAPAPTADRPHPRGGRDSRNVSRPGLRTLMEISHSLKMNGAS